VRPGHALHPKCQRRVKDGSAEHLFLMRAEVTGTGFGQDLSTEKDG